jgi:hypothetical protein
VPKRATKLFATSCVSWTMAKNADFQGRTRALPMLDALRVASPCKASWDDMVGDERVRFCDRCAKNVYNLSAMSREEAAHLVGSKGGDLCARMFQRADGTLMTQDCPVGVRTKRIRRVAIAAVGGGLMAAGLLSARPAGSMEAASCRVRLAELVGEPARSTGVDIVPVPAVMGSIAPPPPDPPADPPKKPPVMGRMARLPSTR